MNTDNMTPQQMVSYYRELSETFGKMADQAQKMIDLMNRVTSLLPSEAEPADSEVIRQTVESGEPVFVTGADLITLPDGVRFTYAQDSYAPEQESVWSPWSGDKHFARRLWGDQDWFCQILNPEVLL